MAGGHHREAGAGSDGPADLPGSGQRSWLRRQLLQRAAVDQEAQWRHASTVPADGVRAGGRGAGGLRPRAPIVTPDGKRRGTWVFRIVLSHSRKGYSEAVSRQTTDEFLRCIENAFAHFGGVPQDAGDRQPACGGDAGRLVRSGAEPQSSVASAGTTGSRSCPPGRTRRGTRGRSNAASATSKATRSRVTRSRSLAEQNRHLLEWESQVADTRIHGTTRQQVGKVFEEVEKPALLATAAGTVRVVPGSPAARESRRARAGQRGVLLGAAGVSWARSCGRAGTAERSGCSTRR